MGLPPPASWAQRPLFMRFAPEHPGPEGKRGEPVIMNTLTMRPFETELFKGHIHISARGEVAGSQADFWGPGEMWEGRNRRFVITFRGKFKERFKMSEIDIGCTWTRPLAPPRGIGVAANVASKFCPGLRLDVTHQTAPYLLNSLVAFADAMHCWGPGDDEREKYNYQPRVTAVRERGTGGIPTTKNVRERLKYLTKKNSQGVAPIDSMYWEPEWEYAFDFYTHVLHLDKFEVHVPLGITSWALHFTDYLAGNAYPIHCRTADGRMLFAFEIWHEAVAMKADPSVWLSAAPQSQRASALATPTAGSPSGLGRERGRDRIPSLSGEVHEGDDMSFYSCAEGNDSGSVPSGESVDDASPPGHAVTPTAGMFEEEVTSPLQRIRTGTPAGDLGAGLGSHVVRWKRKRLRTGPTRRAPWASIQGDIAVGTPVKVLEVKDDKWAYVQLTTGARGWLRARHLAPRDALGGTLVSEEPVSATVTGKRKRLRAQPSRTARRHGAYLVQGLDVYVLQRSGEWALVLLPTLTAGWLKMANIQLEGDSDDEG
eukprot:TRINITY_DN2484_c2_g1_i2.p1 TRINITY_DN2484_c2_g1~~TRINITY_DN2484_c2_g1_i2.p1  ORF type:complete len:541 (+),score=81.23 TRINITY_DN2484_c2_g1_i2:65-1687(+)